MTFNFHLRTRSYLSAIAISVVLTACGADTDKNNHTEKRPNILLILADDLGTHDIGAFGSEIETPHIDSLVNRGTTFTYFHTAPTCSPSRAMLMTGLDSHTAGLGSMGELLTENVRGKPGYEGFLRADALTIAERLKPAGYRSYMAGKWHLGHEDDQGPHNRGFDRSFVALDGGGNHFNNLGYSTVSPKINYREQGETVEVVGDVFSSDNYTNKMIDYIESTPDDVPFFAYLAFTAPHWPTQAPDAYIQKYEQTYKSGWDDLYNSRLEAYTASPRSSGTLTGLNRYDSVPAWDELSKEQQAYEAKKMAVYAAMVDNMDHNIGRVISYLHDKGELENTLVVFLSDNGPDVHDFRDWPAFNNFLKEQDFDNSIENLGRADSFFAYGPGWGRSSNVTGRFHKYVMTQGGINSPLIMSFPKYINPRTTDAFLSIKDIAPTIFDIADVDIEDDGHAQIPQGRSALPLLLGDEEFVYADDEAIGFELFGQSALFMGDWKLIQMRPPFSDREWHLYNVKQDPHELVNLVDTEGDVFRKMRAALIKYENDNGVIKPPDDWLIFDRVQYHNNK